MTPPDWSELWIVCGNKLHKWSGRQPAATPKELLAGLPRLALFTRFPEGHKHPKVPGGVARSPYLWVWDDGTETGGTSMGGVGRREYETGPRLRSDPAVVEIANRRGEWLYRLRCRSPLQTPTPQPCRDQTTYSRPQNFQESMDEIVEKHGAAETVGLAGWGDSVSILAGYVTLQVLDATLRKRPRGSS